MTAQPQPTPPQQPIYVDQLNFALDRHYSRIGDYIDARFERVLIAQRVDRHDAAERDADLLQRVVALEQRVESGFQSLVDTILALAQRVSAIETTQQAMLQTMKDMQQTMKELHAEAMEGINELRKKNLD